MKRVLAGILMTGVVAFPALAALKNGDTAPDFSARASLAGKEFGFSLKDALKKGPVVVYFYPAAFTGGCTLESRTFALNKEKFDALGASIVGVSSDNIAKLHVFSSDPESCGGKIPVASDADRKIATSYNLGTIDRPGLKDTRGEVVTHALTERTTFVIGQDSKIAATLSSEEDKITPAQHVEQSLAAVQKLIAAKKK